MLPEKIKQKLVPRIAEAAASMPGMYATAIVLVAHHLGEMWLTARHWYMLGAVDAGQPAHTADDTDVDMPAASSSESASSTAVATASEILQPTEESSKGHENVVMSYLDVFGKVRPSHNR